LTENEKYFSIIYVKLTYERRLKWIFK